MSPSQLIREIEVKVSISRDLTYARGPLALQSPKCSREVNKNLQINLQNCNLKKLLAGWDSNGGPPEHRAEINPHDHHALPLLFF